jgi:hypothetical protein
VRAGPRTEGLPRVNTPVHLWLPDVDHDLPSRVEDVRGDLVVVAAVTPRGRLERHRTDGVLTLAWATPPRGLLSVACLLVEHERGTPPLWLLRPVGALRRLQRRRYARADVCARVVLSGGVPGAAGAEPWAVAGLLSDLSEGGARVLLDAGERPKAAPADTVLMEVQLATGAVRGPALLVGLDALAAGRHQVRVQFELPERDAERVRRAVMQRQVEARCQEER